MSKDSEQISLDKTGKTLEQSGSNPYRFTVSIKSLSPYFLLISLFMIGATISTIFWSSSTASLQSQLRSSQEELTRTREELEKVKTDLAQFLAQDLPIKGWPNTTGHKVSVRIGVGSTASISNDSLLISVIAIQFEQNPARFTVSAQIISPGSKPLHIRDANVGYKITYPDKNVFEISILEIDAHSVSFLINTTVN